MRVMNKMTLGKILKIWFFAFGIFGTISPAAACHRFSVWKYPYPQRCSVVTPANDHNWYVEFVFAPTPESIYPPEVIYKLEQQLEELRK